MSEIAQTNLQLYNQLLAQGRSEAELRVVHGAYEYATQLYSGWYEGDGRPFVAHTVGTASILAIAKARAELVAAGLLHNAYGNGDFGDGRSGGASAARRRAVRKSVGDDIEALVYGFTVLRITPSSVREIKARLGEMSAFEREVLLMDVANRTEKYVDGAIHYYGDGDWLEELSTALDKDIEELARLMEHSELADLLSRVSAEAMSRRVPDLLRRSGGQKHIGLMIPASCTLRWRVMAVRSLMRLKRCVVAPRRTLQKVKARLGNRAADAT